MDDINKMDNQESNLGSVLQFYFIPVTVIDYITIVDGEVTTIGLPRGYVWPKGYGPLESMRFVEPGEDTANGVKYKPVFTCMVPKDSILNTKLFNKMRNQKYVVAYKDANGLKKLIGLKEEGLKFSAVLDTKQVVAGRNEYAISFYGETSHPAYSYNF